VKEGVRYDMKEGFVVKDGVRYAIAAKFRAQAQIKDGEYDINTHAGERFGSLLSVCRTIWQTLPP